MRRLFRGRTIGVTVLVASIALALLGPCLVGTAVEAILPGPNDGELMDIAMIGYGCAAPAAIGLGLLFFAGAMTVPRAPKPGRCLQCDYDLRGSIAAGSKICPECGAAIPKDSDHPPMDVL